MLLADDGSLHGSQKVCAVSEAHARLCVLLDFEVRISTERDVGEVWLHHQLGSLEVVDGQGWIFVGQFFEVAFLQELLKLLHL